MQDGPKRRRAAALQKSRTPKEMSTNLECGGPAPLWPKVSPRSPRREIAYFGRTTFYFVAEGFAAGLVFAFGDGEGLAPALAGGGGGGPGITGEP